MQKIILLIGIAITLMSCGNGAEGINHKSYTDNAVSSEGISSSDESLDNPHKLIFTNYFQATTDLTAYMPRLKKMISEINFDFDNNIVKIEDKNEDGEITNTATYSIVSPEMSGDEKGKMRTITLTNKRYIVIGNVGRNIYVIGMLLSNIHNATLGVAGMGKYNKEDADLINITCEKHGDMIMNTMNDFFKARLGGQ